ncbi:alkaline phosphatase D family protein [Nocardioides sp. NPDC057767]|uniref:alkaline phosphatase D family protein n=1 Tax=unclassified Nocardioides TaxID=2615069 RepID=UPI00366BBC47
MKTPHPTPPAFGRRTVLMGAAAGAAALTAAGVAGLPSTAYAGASPYFAHGVASGDPRPGAVVLWTRVTPTAEAVPGSGAGPEISVSWQMSKTSDFARIVAKGTVSTDAGRDHTVKVDAAGLAPETWYFYRFRYNDAFSAVGRTRTAPAASATPDNVRLGIVSCSNLQAGWFSAYRHLAAREDLHAVLHMGDYIYEYGPGEYGYGNGDVDIRSHVPAHEMVTLADYRQRHAQYKTDTDLQTLHRRYPFIVTWDDHESVNDAYKGGAENHQDATEGDFHTRRAAAHQAYDEWMPVRMSGTAASGDGDQLFRRIAFGQLAEISMLDLRTYRDKQASTPLVDPAVNDPGRTITGSDQMAFLKGSLDNARAQWKVIGNPVMIAPVTLAGLPDADIAAVNEVVGHLPADGLPYNVDQWDGYTHDRRQVFDHIRDHGVTDALFVTGDIHSGWACELPTDKTNPLSPSVGVEFVGTSVTSNNLKDITDTPRRTTSLAVEGVLQANNPHVKYLNFDDHGFSVLDITSARAQMDWYVIGDRTDAETGLTWTASYKTDAGTSRVTAVDSPLPLDIPLDTKVF